jgi:hypothetical protein
MITQDDVDFLRSFRLVDLAPRPQWYMTSNYQLSKMRILADKLQPLVKEDTDGGQG